MLRSAEGYHQMAIFAALTVHHKIELTPNARVTQAVNCRRHLAPDAGLRHTSWCLPLATQQWKMTIQAGQQQHQPQIANNTPAMDPSMRVYSFQSYQRARNGKIRADRFPQHRPSEAISRKGCDVCGVNLTHLNRTLPDSLNMPNKTPTLVFRSTTLFSVSRVIEIWQFKSKAVKNVVDYPKVTKTNLQPMW